VRIEGRWPDQSSRELLSGRMLRWQEGETVVTLDPEDVAVIGLE
jgi:hypothetical protein